MQVGFAQRPNLPVAAYRVVQHAANLGAAVHGVRALYNYSGGPSYAQIKNAFSWAKGKYNTHQARKAYMKSKGGVGRSRYPRPMKKLKAQVKELKRVAEADTGTLIFRDMEASRLQCGTNEQASLDVIGSSNTLLEEVLAQLRYYNPSSPSTLVTADGATGSYQKEFYVKRSYAKIELTNNYQVPVDVCIYRCHIRDDTTISPDTAWSGGMTDISNVGRDNVNIYPSDSQQFVDLWRVEKTLKKTLQPGRSMSTSHSTKSFQYDPSLSDSHTSTYQTRNKAFVFLVVVQGVIGHDTSANEIGLLQAGVDIKLSRTFEVKYNAGADIKFIYSTTTLNSFTNGGVVSSKPVSDNIGYSTA